MSSPLRELVARFVTGADTKPLEKADGLMDSLKAKSQKATGVFGKLRERVAAFEQKAAAQMGALEKRTGAVGQVVKQVGAAFGALAVVASLKSFASNFIDEAQTLVATSDRLRITTDQLQVLGAVGRSVGLDLNATAGVLGTLRGKLDEATRGLGDGGYTFRRLGVQFREGRHQARSLYEVFGDVATALNGVQRESRRLILTERLLGPEGRRFLSLFGSGRDAIRDFQNAMEAAGGGVSQEAIQSGLRFSQTWNLASLSIDTLRSKFAIFLFPKLTELVKFINRITIYVNKTTVVTNTLRAGFAALVAYAIRGAVMWAVANAPLVIQFALIAATIGIVILVVDDLINLFDGGKSVIGGFIDELFGVGTAAAVVEDLKGRFDEFRDFVRMTVDAVKELWDLFGSERTSAGETTRTPIRRPGADTRTVRPWQLNGGADPTRVANANAAFMEALRNPQGARRVSVPVQGRPGRGTGVPGGAGVQVPAPSGRRDLNVNNQNRVQVNVTAPSGNPQDIGRASETGVRRALDQSNRQQVRDLQGSGLIRFAPEE